MNALLRKDDKINSFYPQLTKTGENCEIQNFLHDVHNCPDSVHSMPTKVPKVLPSLWSYPY